MVRKKFSKAQIILGISCTILLTFFLIFYIWHQAESIRIGYKTRQLEEEILSLKKEIEKLEVKKSSLLSLERVEKIAREELKLTSPEKEQIISDNLDQ